MRKPLASRRGALALAAVALAFAVLMLLPPAPHPPPPPSSAVWRPAASYSSGPLGVWSNLTASAASPPPPRQDFGMAYDPNQKAVFLFGGQDSGRNPLGDTWRFANGSWTNLTGNLSAPPGPRWGLGLVYDLGASGILLFGGRNSTAWFNDTWVLNQTGWHNVSVNNSPPPETLSLTPLAYDGLDNYVLLFNGLSSSGVFLNDTWSYSNGSWSNLSATSTGSPPIASFPTLAFDQVGHRVVAFGGGSSGGGGCWAQGLTWGYANGSWTNLTASAGGPPRAAWGSQSSAFDPLLGSVLQTGGYDARCQLVNETWAFHQGAWSNLTNHSIVGPAPSWYGRMVFDPDLPGDLLFGGLRAPDFGSGSPLPLSSETWEFLPRLSVTILVSPLRAVVPARVDFATSRLSGGLGSVSFNWSFGDGSANGTRENVSYTYTTPGTYAASLLVRDSAGRSASLAFTIKVFALPTVRASVTPEPGGVALKASFNATGTPGLPPITYRWDFGDGNLSRFGNVTHTYAISGNYTWNITVTDSAGNVAQASGALYIANGLSASLSTTIDHGQVPLNVGFTAAVSGGATPYNISWEFGDGASASGATQVSHTYFTTGDFVANLTIHDAYGAHVKLNVTIRVVPVLAAGGSATPSAGYAPLKVNFSAKPVGGEAPFDYNWSFGVGSNNSSLRYAEYTYQAVGNYSAFLIVADAYGDRAFESFNVTVAAPFSGLRIVATPLRGLLPLLVNFSASPKGGLGPWNYSWNFGDLSPTAWGSPVVHEFQSAGTFLVNLSAIDQTGVRYNRSQAVQVGTPLLVQLSVDRSSTPPGASVNLTATVSGGLAPFTFRWFNLPAGCSSTNLSVLICTPIAPGSFQVEVFASDSAGDVANSTVALAVAETGPGGQSDNGPVITATIAAIVAVLVGAAIWQLYRMRRKPSSPVQVPRGASRDRPPKPPARKLGPIPRRSPPRPWQGPPIARPPSAPPQPVRPTGNGGNSATDER